MNPLRIGPVELWPPVGLAPMAGYTDAAFRSLCHAFGAAFSFTEMVNARGTVEGCPRTWHLLETFPDEGPVAAHLYGSEPDVMAEAARRVEATGRFAWVDVNAGCPVRRIVRRGAGAALIQEPDRLVAIVRAICRAVSLPVTVKTRIGLARGDGSAAELARRCEEAGAAAIFLHARAVRDGHHGPVVWEALAEAQSAVTIPVIGNGGVTKPEDVMALMTATGVRGVIIGRVALGRPWFFSEVRSVILDEPPPSPPDLKTLIRRQLRLLLDLKIREHSVRRGLKFGPERGAVMALRGHLVAYLRGIPGIAQARRELDRLRSEDDVMQWVERYADTSGSGATFR